jgi:predicted nucleic acid-binding protein
MVESGASPEAILAIPVDPGEAEAIWLAKHSPDLRFLLIDERRGRQLARQRGLAIVGTGGVLLVAKAVGLLPEVRSFLDRLTQIGYHLAPRLEAEILRLAGEKS